MIIHITLLLLTYTIVMNAFWTKQLRTTANTITAIFANHWKSEKDSAAHELSNLSDKAVVATQGKFDAGFVGKPRHNNSSRCPGIHWEVWGGADELQYPTRSRLYLVLLSLSP